MNKVIMMGRLTRDIDMRFTQGEKSTAVGRFSIAVDKRFKKEGEPDADFFNCIAFGKTAENIEKFFKKGSKIAIVGELRNNNYTNKDGVKVYAIDIVVNEFDFCEGRNQTAAPAPATEAAPAEGFVSIPAEVVEELPFA